MILDQDRLLTNRGGTELFEDLKRREPGHVVHHDVIDLSVHDLLLRYAFFACVCREDLFGDGHSHDVLVGYDRIKRCARVQAWTRE